MAGRRSKIGRAEKLTEIVQIRLSKSLLQRIDMIAEANRQTRSKQIYILLVETLEEERKSSPRRRNRGERRR